MSIDLSCDSCYDCYDCQPFKWTSTVISANKKVNTDLCSWCVRNTLWLIAVRDFPPKDRNRECTQSNAVIKKCCPYDELIIAWIQEPLWTNSASIVFGRCTCPLASTISNKFIRSWNKTSCLLIFWVNFCILLLFNKDIKQRQGVSEGSN